MLLDTWRLMIDDGRSQDGDDYYKQTARKPVLRAGAATLAAAGIAEGEEAVVSTEAGAIALSTQTADLPDGVVWVPANSDGLNVRRVLHAGAGDVVRLDRGGTHSAAGDEASTSEGDRA